jgi:hypothetical protein
MSTSIASAYVSSTLMSTSTSVSVSGQNKGSDPAAAIPEIKQWPLWKAFEGGYIPLMFAVIFKLFWTSIYANIKLIEPFIQLSTPKGGFARNVFHTFYLSSNLTPYPLLALLKGRWLVFWTSLVYVVVSLLAPLAAECIFVDTNYGCPNPNPAQPDNPCWPPKLSHDPTILRLLQALLSYVAVMTLVIMFMVLGSQTGVSSDPSSIAGITALVHHPDLLADFRELGSDASSKEIKSRLAGKRYHLGSYQRSDGVWRYGIVPLDPSPQVGSTYDSIPQPVPRKRRSPLVRSAMDLCFIFFILGVLGVVVAYFKDGSDSGFNRFFNSNSFGPRFFMASAHVIL